MDSKPVVDQIYNTRLPHARMSDPFPLDVEGLTVAYNGKPVLWNIDYRAPQGSRIAIIGPNGAGKTTFLKTILGLLHPLSGTVRFFGLPIKHQRSRIAYVPQRESVDWDFPASVLDVVLMGLYGKMKWFGSIKPYHRLRALNALDQLNMKSLAGCQIGQLSGGQQQRVFLCRALVQDADLYLMDEPFAGIDAATEQVIADMFKTLQRQGKTILCVHHDLHTVYEYFDHVLILNRRKINDGPIEQSLRPDLLYIAYEGKLPSFAMGT